MVPRVRRESRMASAAEIRSPRTSVMSAASIGDVGAGAHRQAQVGLREGGGVVHAVADHRDDLALGLQPGDHVGLVLGHDLGDDLGDAHLRRDLLGHGPLSPVSSTGDEPEPDEPRDGGRAGRLDLVRDDEDASRPPVPADRDDGLTLTLCSSLGLRQVRAAGTPTSRRAGLSRPTTTACPSTTPCTPRPWMLSNDSGVGRSPICWAAPLAMACATGCSEASSRAPASRSSSSRVGAGVRDDVEEGHLARGDGAGLVQHDRVDLAGGLQDLRPLDEDAELRTRARCRPAGRWESPARARTGRR